MMIPQDDATQADGGVSTPEPTSVFAPPLRAAAIAIMTMVALSAFEGLAVAAALPEVAGDLGRVALLPWVVTTYLMVAGVSTVVAGALVDRVGVAATFKVAVSVFIVGGVLCGFAPSMEILIAARVLQGIGAGATNAVGLAAVGLVFPPKLVGRAFAVNAMVWGAMSIAGPAIAAALLTVASWRWIFYVNIPLGAAALMLGWRALPGLPAQDAERPTARGKIDPLSVVLLTVFSAGMLLALNSLSWASLPVAVVALGAGWWVMRHARGRDDALIAPRHVLSAPFGPLGWTIALLLIGCIGTQIYVPVYVSGARGAGTGLTAWSVLFFTLGWTSGAQLSSRLMDHRTPLQVTTFGASIVAPACALVGLLAYLDAPLWSVFAVLFVAGFGMGNATNSALTLLRQLAPDAELGRATAAHQYIRSQGFAGGAALGGAVLLLVVSTRTGDVEAVRSLLGDQGSDVIVAPALGAAVADGFAIAALVCAGVAALAHLPLRAVRRWTQLEASAEAASVDG
jgi:MFS family permease